MVLQDRLVELAATARRQPVYATVGEAIFCYVKTGKRKVYMKRKRKEKRYM
jgi:hypothetical protein